MTLTPSWGLRTLGAWLIITGICVVFAVGHPVLHVLLGGLAVVSGILLLMGR